MVDGLPGLVVKGRGAVSNAAGRFEPHARMAVDDGWGPDPDGAEKLRTTVTAERAKSALTRNGSPDIPFDRSLNPYRGCEHGCVYCYARPSHAYVNLSPGLDFESRLFAKNNVAEVLEAELRKPGYRARPVMIGSNTDPYQPIEQDRRLTRQVLEVLRDFRHPAVLITKSHRVVRDVDVLADMARNGLVSVGVSVTTLDTTLARTLEPRAATPPRRLDAVRTLSDAGVPVCLMVSPVIPALTDHELEAILAAGKEAGAKTAAYILLRLPGEVAGLFVEWLHAHAPDRARRVLNLLGQSRHGGLNTSEFGERMTGVGPHADLLGRRFRVTCRKLGLGFADATAYGVRSDLFRPPPRIGDQLALW
ncbi:MAG: PA0069 family radical SAM protein [Alphaproteobacteria bacterium]|nr:PA0069 family radical SAM protein [Alphaproteobacteria bacterium]